MKKNLWFAALVGVALTGCVNEEIPQTKEQAEKLTFASPVMATQSRASVQGEISGTTYPQNEAFMVYCKSYKGNFKGWEDSNDISDYFNAQGEEATNTNAAGGGKYWATTTIHYWPEVEYNLAFAAYSPAEFTTDATSIQHTESGLQIQGFQTEDESDDQYDLMYTPRSYNLNKTAYGNSAVPLVFKHALSSIVFSTQKSSDDVNYKITNIEICGSFKQQGNFNQNITETITDGVYSEQENPIWDNLIDPRDPTEAYVPSLNSTGVDVPSTSPLQFTSGTSALLLIPQDIPNDAKVIVSYDKTTNPGTPSEKTLSTKATILLKSFSYNNDGNVHFVNTWEIGKRYVYRIMFGQNTRIYFEPTCVDWDQQPTLIYTIN